MKRIILYILLVIAAIPAADAQGRYDDSGTGTSLRRDYQRDSYMGIRFGLNVPTIRYKGTGGAADASAITRFHLGVVYGMKLGNALPFYFETGLSYTEKGGEVEKYEDFEYRKAYLKYFEVPLVVKYKIETGIDDLTVQPFFGGFLALGIAGKTKFYESRIKVSSYSDSRYKRFDSGLRIGCGAAYQNFYFEMAYDIGLFNIAGSRYTDYNYDDFDGHIRTGNLEITLGVDF